MSLLNCLFDYFKRKEDNIGEKARQRVLRSIKDIRKIFSYPYLNNKERYAYNTLRYLHKLIIDPVVPPDAMLSRDKEIYVDFCKQVMRYSDYVLSSLVSKREENVEELEEEFVKINNSRFASCSMPFEAYQKLRSK